MVSWGAAHYSAQPGSPIKILWGLTEYTKRGSLVDPPEAEHRKDRPNSGPENSAAKNDDLPSPADARNLLGKNPASDPNSPHIEVVPPGDHKIEEVLEQRRHELKLRALTTHETGRDFKELPGGTYSYAHGASINWKETEAQRLSESDSTNNPVPRHMYFEVQKRGNTYSILVFCSDSDAARLAKATIREVNDIEVTAAAEPSGEFSNIVILPLSSIIASRYRQVFLKEGGALGLLDMQLRR